MSNFPPPRPLNPDSDLPGLLRLRQAMEANDQIGLAATEETLRQQMNLPGHDPSQERWVIAAPADADALIGSAMVWIEPPERQSAHADIGVHPAWRRQGLGSALLAQVLAYCRAQSVRRVAINAAAKLPEAGAFLNRHNFKPVGAYTVLSASADLRLPKPIWPYGYRPRTYAEAPNLSFLTEAMNRCYEDLWGHHPVSEAQMAEWLPGFTPEGIFLVFSEKGWPVGICRVEMNAERSAKNQAPTGVIDAPGIVSPHRRHDLYRAMVITGMRWLRENGAQRIELESWGDRPDVLDMYQEIGFSVVHKHTAFVHSLSYERMP